MSLFRSLLQRHPLSRCVFVFMCFSEPQWERDLPWFQQQWEVPGVMRRRPHRPNLEHQRLPGAGTQVSESQCGAGSRHVSPFQPRLQVCTSEEKLSLTNTWDWFKTLKPGPTPQQHWEIKEVLVMLMASTISQTNVCSRAEKIVFIFS